MDTSFFDTYRNNISTLSPLDDTRYENIFKVFKTNNTYVYNIVNTISLPSNINNELFTIIKPLPTDTWMNLSYIYYNNINLWWLILIVNNIINPFVMPNTLRIVKSEYVDLVISTIQSQIN